MSYNLARRAATVGAVLMTATIGLGAVAGSASAVSVTSVDLKKAGCTTQYGLDLAANQLAWGPKVNIGYPIGGYDLGDPGKYEAGIVAATNAYIACVG